MTIPILPSSDFDATARFYGRLGFAERARWPGDYLILAHQRGIELHFWAKPGLVPATNESSCYVRFEGVAEARELYDEWAGSGLGSDQLHPPEGTDYGLLEFAVRDDDRNVIRIGGVAAS